MDLLHALRTTGSARTFTSEPVADSVVVDLLDTARFAPSGGNRQPWRVAVVKDPVLRREMATLMQAVWNQYMGYNAAGITPFSRSPEGIAPVPTPNPLLARIEEVPVVLAIAADLGKVAIMDRLLDRPAVVGGASIYPFCWSILLAAQEHDLSGVMTTFLTGAEPVAGPVLGLPENHALVATIFLGHPEQRITKLKRQPVETFATIDRFDGATFGGG